VSYNATTRVATLNPSADLAANTQYTATLTSGIRSAAGTPLANTSWTFTTAGAADTTAPTVTARTPAAAAGVPVGNDVTATFSEAVQAVSGTTFTLKPGTSTSTAANIGAAVSYNATTRVATLNPTANLAANTQYTATLTGGSTAIRDTAGNPLTNVAWTFTTAAAPAPPPDTTAPTVTTRSPSSNATSVSRTGNITVTFSEAVSGVSTTTFVLKNASGTTIPAAVTRDGTSNRWILNPNSTLASRTRFTVTVTGGATAIRDAAGNSVANTSWSFTTGR
jgi:hypothetical protein